jgi:hypothetical protein
MLKQLQVPVASCDGNVAVVHQVLTSHACSAVLSFLEHTSPTQQSNSFCLSHAYHSDHQDNGSVHSQFPLSNCLQASRVAAIREVQPTTSYEK